MPTSFLPSVLLLMIRRKDVDIMDWSVKTLKLISLIGFVICVLLEFLFYFAERVRKLTT